jgi:hypothetical protein
VLDCSTHDLVSDRLEITSRSFRKVAKRGSAYTASRSGSGSGSSGWYRVRKGDTLAWIERDSK